MFQQENQETKHITAQLKNKTPGQFIQFGTYPQAKEGKDQTPITWVVLKNDGNRLLIISEKILDCMQYHKTKEDITWEHSDIRKWLNHDFLQKAFTQEESAAIDISYLRDNGQFSCGKKIGGDFNAKYYRKRKYRYDKNGCEDTYDKIFLLNVAQARELSVKKSERVFKDDGNDRPYTYNLHRAAKGTSYAIERGLWYYKGTEDHGDFKTYPHDKYKDCVGNSEWWLRNRGSLGASCAPGVRGRGDVRDIGRDVNLGEFGVRPALHLRLPTKTK